ncbi:hypothetical protein Tco_1459878, partial [Tanacetum coccineum]
SNSFQAFDDQDLIDKEEEFLQGVDEEFGKVVWPKLKSKMDEIMKLGVYPSAEIRNDWSLHQLDYFFHNCSKFGLEPYNDDDDVESKNDGMADMMKPENIGNNGPEVELMGVESDEGGYSFCGILETRVKKHKLNKICSKVFGNWDWMSNVALCDGGTGIVIGWDPNAVRIMLHSQTS